MIVDWFLVIGFLAAVCVWPCEQCSPVEPLTNALRAAEKNLVDGRIALNMETPKEVVLKVSPPTCHGKSNLATMYRIAGGATAMFNCTVPECEYGDLCPQVDSILWGHQNYSVRRVINQRYTSPFKYSVTKNATFSRLSIHNVTAGAAGPVHCLWHYKLNKFCIMEFYDLKPLLTAAEIFVATAQNVSGPAGKTVTLRCDLREPLYGALSLDQRYIWRYEGQVIMAPSRHPMAGLVRPGFPVKVVQEGQYTSAILTSPPKSRSGRYECWVRPFEELDEWFVSVSTLYLT